MYIQKCRILIKQKQDINQHANSTTAIQVSNGKVYIDLICVKSDTCDSMMNLALIDLS
jgi:hypothetical protein